MNDRFKFRVFGLCCNSKLEKNWVNITEVGKFFVDKDGNLIDESAYFDPINHPEHFIVEQCTGLKDMNGNIIYEGDKVEITIFGSIGPNGGYVDSDEIYKGTVVWDTDCFLVKTDTDMLLFPHSEDCIEIIGNIHEQTEQKDK